jgi:cardiolipin synthase
MKKKELLTIPNLISSYRLVVFPLILYFIIAGHERLFAIFLVINLITDLIDGVIARRFHMETEFGAKLDSFADNLTYLLAFTGLLVFKLEDLRPHFISFVVFIAVLVLTVVVSLIKFRKFPSFHLYSTKISGYIQAAFFICTFFIRFYPPLYFLMISWAILAAIECLTIDMLIPEMRSNIKGLYWVLKERKEQKDRTS